MGRIEQILRKNGPLISGKLAQSYASIYNTSNQAARKAISRARSPVQNICDISFNNNQKFIYLEEHYRKNIFYDRLYQCIREHSKAYYSVLYALETNYGYGSIDFLPAFTFIPTQNLKGHRRFDRILRDLSNNDLILYDEDMVEIQYVQNTTKDTKYYRSLKLSREIILKDFYEWARKSNLIGFNSGQMLSSKANFCKLQWCFTAPSYVLGIKPQDDNLGFIILDVFLDKKVEIETIENFMRKIAIVKSLKEHKNFIPIIIGYGYSQEAFFKLKNNGVLIYTIDNLFGKNYSKTLKELVNLVRHASAIISTNPDTYFDYLEKISKIEGKFNNIKGELFEFLTAYYYRKIGYYIEINKIIKNRVNGKRYEIDVIAKRNDQHLIIECKGYKRKLDTEYVKKWLTERIPNIRKALLDISDANNLTFELWCTGGFKEESIELLENYIANQKKYTIKYYDREDIIKKAKEKNLPKVIQGIKEFYS